MTATTGSTLLVSDYNSIQTTVSNILGLNPQGYGLPYVASRPVSRSDKVRASDWKNLQSDLNMINKHVTGSYTQLTTGTRSQPITSDIPASYTDLSNFLLDSGNGDASRRFTCAESEYYVDPVTSNTINYTGGVSTRTTVWGIQESYITHVVRVGFPTADTMVYFFNLGSYITFLPFRVGAGLNSADYEWFTFINWLRSGDPAVPVLHYDRSHSIVHNPGSTINNIYNATTSTSGISIDVSVTKSLNGKYLDFTVAYRNNDIAAIVIDPSTRIWTTLV